MKLSELFEELSPQQKKKVDRWTKNDYAFSDHAFGGNHQRITIPLESGDLVAPRNLQTFLKRNDYVVKDYKKGIATDKYGRDISIGKALNRTKAPENLTRAFVNDKNRSSGTHNDLAVTISRHPYDVAGMSTNRGWYSCMNMDDGCYRQKLIHDIKHGTHVAYLHHNDDPELNRPIARIALKPYNSDYETILRPENKVYGDGGEAFTSTVHNWAEKHFPTNSGQLYVKHPKVYDDEGYQSGEEEGVHRFVISKDKKTLKQYAYSDNPTYRAIAARYGDKEIIDDLLDHLESTDVLIAIAHRNNAEYNKKLFQIISKGNRDHDDVVRIESAIARYTTHKYDLDKLTDKDYTVSAILAKFCKSKDHLLKLAKSKNEDAKMAICLRTDSAVKEAQEAIAKDKNYWIREILARNTNNEKILDILVKDKQFDVRVEVARRGYKKYLDILMHDEDGEVRLAVAQNGQKENAEFLLNDKFPAIRKAAKKRLRELEKAAKNK